MEMYFYLGNESGERDYGRNRDYRNCHFTVVNTGRRRGVGRGEIADVILSISGKSSAGWSANSRIMLPHPAAKALGRALTELSAMEPHQVGRASFLHQGGNLDEPVQKLTCETRLTWHELYHAYGDESFGRDSPVT